MMKSKQPFKRVGNVLLYENQPVCLAGQLAANVHLPEHENGPLDAVDKHGNNIWRHWMIAYWLYDTPAGKANAPFKFQNGKWDLRYYNSDYFRRLRETLQAAADRGIVVVLSLFDRYGLTRAKGAWANNPWNTDNNVNTVIRTNTGRGLPEIFQVFTNAALKSLQQKYVEKVVTETRGYWNVFYEIMNEPDGPPADDSTMQERVKWADWMAGVIHNKARIGGVRKQLIYYNDTRGGADVSYWRTNQGTYKNYAQVDGVTFHGNPGPPNPEDNPALPQIEPASYPFAGEKLFQVSSDGYREKKTGTNTLYRDMEGWNRETAEYVFSRNMQFTAFSKTVASARGIGQAGPPPSPLLRPALLNHWVRSDGAYHVRFFEDDVVAAFTPGDGNGTAYNELDRLTVLGYLPDQFVRLYSSLEGQTHDWKYSFENNGSRMHFKRDDNHDGTYEVSLIFNRFDQAPPEQLEQFLYHWYKVWDNSHEVPGTDGIPDDYHLRFYADGSVLTFFATAPYQVIDRLEVRRVTGSEIDLYNTRSDETTTFSYHYQSGDRLVLTRQSDNYKQTYRRFARPALPKGNTVSYAPFLYRWKKVGGDAPLFNLRFNYDGSYVALDVNAPYPEMARGEIRALNPATRTIRLWSHDRGVQENWSYTFKVEDSATAHGVCLTLETSTYKSIFQRAH